MKTVFFATTAILLLTWSVCAEQHLQQHQQTRLTNYKVKDEKTALQGILPATDVSNNAANLQQTNDAQKVESEVKVPQTIASENNNLNRNAQTGLDNEHQHTGRIHHGRKQRKNHQQRQKQQQQTQEHGKVNKAVAKTKISTNDRRRNNNRREHGALNEQKQKQKNEQQAQAKKQHSNLEPKDEKEGQAPDAEKTTQKSNKQQRTKHTKHHQGGKHANQQDRIKSTTINGRNGNRGKQRNSDNGNKHQRKQHAHQQPQNQQQEQTQEQQQQQQQNKARPSRQATGWRQVRAIKNIKKY